MRHFIDLSSWSTKDLWHIIKLATFLKLEWQTGGNKPVLKNKVLGMVFQKPSLRTRVSFEVAMQHLGGQAIMIGPDEVGLGKRESAADVARVLSGYVQGIMARVFDHKCVEELAAYSRVPVINGLSDDRHPCQAMADLLTIFEHFGRLKGLRLAYVGDGNNMAASLLIGAAHFGMKFAAATPKSHEVPVKVLVAAASHARSSGATIEAFTEPRQAVEGADIVYTDTWTSMGQEEEAEKREAIFRPYQVNADLIKLAKDDHVVMHCLPAHRGQEITDEVADGSTSVIFQQAENRLHVQKALLVKLLILDA
jgi:ornithine carbamoyltransferase